MESINIVVCEDEPLIAQGIKKILEGAFDGLRLNLCHDGQTGLAALLLDEPELLITDIRMPEMDGLQMIERYRQGRGQEGLNVIIISAHSEFEYALQALKFGVKDYLIKPINRFELLAAVRKLCGAKLRERGPLKENMADEGGGDEQIRKALHYIEANFYRNLSLEEVSARLPMNSSYFSTLFKKSTGQTYSEYLCGLRLEKARGLLLNTDMRVNKISAMVGYHDTKYFTKLFKERFGLSPSQLRLGGNDQNSTPSSQ